MSDILGHQFWVKPELLRLWAGFHFQRFLMDVASSGRKTASERDYAVSTAIITSPAVFAGGKTQQRRTRKERRPSPIYLHQSCTVTPQRSGYFHEPFNVASLDIGVIYHPAASLRGPAADNTLLFVSRFL